jgi:acetyl-CoA carboxylase biotin carboxyl carrier protein
VTDELLPAGDDAFDGVPVIEPEAAEPVVVDPVARVADDGDASLLALIDRLALVLERSELSELEVEAGGTGLLLRKPVALERVAASSLDLGGAAGGSTNPSGAAATTAPIAGAEKPAQRPSVKAPLTGLFYGAPSPGATAYVSVGDHVSVGQVIGLIEAMKLFNEIKSDLAGRVVRIVAENGALVKAKSPLIEVEPQ